MPGDDPLTFPDAPRAELDQALATLVEQAGRVLETQGRLRALVRANRAVVSHLELATVLRTIIESAVELVGAPVSYTHLRAHETQWRISYSVFC